MHIECTETAFLTHIIQKFGAYDKFCKYEKNLLDTVMKIAQEIEIFIKFF